MTKSRKNTKPDVLIIGGGPAGLSAFKWCAELGMSCLLIEGSEQFGGQLNSIYNPITNYLGRTATNGRELLDHFLSQFDDLEKHFVLGASVVEFDPQKVSATLSNGRVIEARAAIIATGVRRRELGVPGEREFAGRGILESGARDKELVKGKRIAIIGGGDAALENASILSNFADKVYVIHRRSEFSARKEFVESAAKNRSVQLVLDSTVGAFYGDKYLDSVGIVGDSETRQIEVDNALIRIGAQPNTEMFTGKMDLDGFGYIVTDRLGRTSANNVFAVGDVANPTSPTISSAAGSGATAIKTVFTSIYSQA